MKRHDIAVVGGGLAGMATAIAFAAEGFDTLLAAPPQPADGRSTALIGESVAFLARIGLGVALETRGEPLATMRIIDDTGRLLRAPTTRFNAFEIGLSAFGYNILNVDLLAALKVRTEALNAHLTVLPHALRDLAVDADGVRLVFDDGLEARVGLVVGADGRGSLVRERAGIALREWSYPQSALVFNIEHRLPHDRISTEFHTRHGPFTQVPLPGRQSSIVWVDAPEAAELTADLPPERLAERAERRMHSILGSVTIASAVQRFPLKGASAAEMTAPRIALVGEAAHVFPPIGAQGLNLGMRDASAIVDAAKAQRDDPGAPEALSRYAASRRGDVRSRSIGVDLLNRSLLTDFLPTQIGRSAGLAALSAIPLLRRFAIREGVSPGSGLKGVAPSLAAAINGSPPV